MSVSERRAAAESHLKSIGMARYGWLHKDLQVAFHTARNKNEISDKHLTALGNLFKATTVERMKPHLAKANEIAKKTSGTEAFFYLMHALEGGASSQPPAAGERTRLPAQKPTVFAPLEKKHLVIKHADLHPEVKQKVKELLAAREKRIGKMLLGNFGFIVGLGTLRALGAHIPSDSFIQRMILGNLASAGMLTFGYKLGSPLVREATKRVVKMGKAIEFFDARKTISVVHVRESHPFLVVDRKGNVHLIPKTKYQTALAKAQQTFLKHVVPGRYRARL